MNKQLSELAVALSAPFEYYIKRGNYGDELKFRRDLSKYDAVSEDSRRLFSARTYAIDERDILRFIAAIPKPYTIECSSSNYNDGIQEAKLANPLKAISDENKFLDIFKQCAGSAGLSLRRMVDSRSVSAKFKISVADFTKYYAGSIVPSNRRVKQLGTMEIGMYGANSVLIKVTHSLNDEVEFTDAVLQEFASHLRSHNIESIIFYKD